jgi:hypothetical protein
MKQKPISRNAGRKKGSRQEWLIYKSDESGEELCYLTLEGLARSSRIPVPTLGRMIKQGLIASLPGEDQLFSQQTVRRIAKIERLRLQLQIDFDSLELILDLLDRMEAMEREIALLRSAGL